VKEDVQNGTGKEPCERTPSIHGGRNCMPLRSSRLCQQ